ncbi:hypothetical protein ACIQCF_02545 [Streptomyces sp. NPDC088353]|uniref:hypothetical protein n=1 Tax=Streptomyces sp. NPDC088353 TaxID=3365855 RepID=UPI003807859E
MHGGRGNTGIDKRVFGSPQQPSPELQAALGELVVLVRELRQQLPAPTGHTLDVALPDVAPSRQL